MLLLQLLLAREAANGVKLEALDKLQVDQRAMVVRRHTVSRLTTNITAFLTIVVMIATICERGDHHLFAANGCKVHTTAATGAAATAAVASCNGYHGSGNHKGCEPLFLASEAPKCGYH